MVNLTITGNTYPVTENPFSSPNTFFGKAPKAGYQSHYVAVEIDRKGNGIPILQEFEPKTEPFDELVVFDGMQVLPLFLIYCQDSTSTLLLETNSSPSSSSTSPPPQFLPRQEISLGQEKKRSEWIANQPNESSNSGSDIPHTFPFFFPPFLNIENN